MSSTVCWLPFHTFAGKCDSPFSLLYCVSNAAIVLLGMRWDWSMQFNYTENADVLFSAGRDPENQTLFKALPVRDSMWEIVISARDWIKRFTIAALFSTIIVLALLMTILPFSSGTHSNNNSLTRPIALGVNDMRFIVIVSARRLSRRRALCTRC